MGLDITAYSRLRLAPEAESLPEDERRDSYFRPLDFTAFPGRLEGLKEDWYAYDASNVMGFQAGSYGGYNQWREQLAQLAGYAAVANPNYRTYPTHSTGAWEATGGPFWELINFADNEGTIGPVVAAKLARDFAEFEERARDFDPDGDGWFYEKYKTWRQAFEMAADGGAVDFH